MSEEAKAAFLRIREFTSCARYSDAELFLAAALRKAKADGMREAAAMVCSSEEFDLAQAEAIMARAARLEQPR